MDRGQVAVSRMDRSCKACIAATTPFPELAHSGATVLELLVKSVSPTWTDPSSMLMTGGNAPEGGGPTAAKSSGNCNIWGCAELWLEPAEDAAADLRAMVEAMRASNH